MASRNPLLPTQAQCFSLTDDQCRMIQEILDPEGLRAYKDWAAPYQPELIRLYMTMASFPQIETAMKRKLDCSYKTYNNRFRDWFFPIPRYERESIVVELYAVVSNANNPGRTETGPPPQNRTLLPIRPSQPQQSSQSLRHNMFSPPPQVESGESSTHNRMSISTINTYTSSSASSAYTRFDDTFSNPRFSVATTNSSVSSGSQYVAPPVAPPPSVALPRPRHEPQPRPLKPPKHDPILGLWNDILRVIPCGKDHSRLMWHTSFLRCSVCGFSRWHALMAHARSMSCDAFLAAIRHLHDLVRVDFAGNSIHFLMCAGVGLEYFSQILHYSDNCQNVFGQNPLHVLNPQDLGDQLISLLEWYKSRDEPLLSQRDIYCRTPLQTLLQHPLERSMYRKVLRTFPCAIISLRSLDTSGRSVLKMMHKASLKVKSDSLADFGKIQGGITETRQFILEAEKQVGGMSDYGWHNIAEGARGIQVFGGIQFQCRICNLTNAHSDSYLDQMACARQYRPDCNAPDDTGITPAHLLVIRNRCNNDPERTQETPAQTAKLFEMLLPPGCLGLREALHALDPEGNSLIFNIATRGFWEILKYALSLEDPSRRSAMVNACSKRPPGPSGKASDKEWSVLEAVQEKIDQVTERITLSMMTTNEKQTCRLCEERNRLTICKHILISAKAELKPNVTTRWKICE